MAEYRRFFAEESCRDGQEIYISDILGETGKILRREELNKVNDYVYQKVAELRAQIEEKKKKRKGDNK